MHTHVQKNSTVQKIADSKAASLFDSSAQSESLQRKVDMVNNAAQRAEAQRPNNTGMPDNLKSGIESLSGFSMDDVRVHYNSSKPATVQALAYTQGTDIHVAPGQEKHLPHEAWHVAQQMAGRVSPTTNINEMPINDDDSLEHEADVMGEKAVQCKKTKGSNITNRQLLKSAIQRMAFYNESNPTRTIQIGKDGKIRSDQLTNLVDWYKRQMLTRIAIEIQLKKDRNYYGPHISVAITGGVWYVSINSTYKDKRENVHESLIDDVKAVQENIVSEYGKMDVLGIESEGNLYQKASLIAYRWASKGKGFVVIDNGIAYNSDKSVIKKGWPGYNDPKDHGCVHGEMQVVSYLQYLQAEDKLRRKGVRNPIPGKRVIRIGGTLIPCYDCAVHLGARLPEAGDAFYSPDVIAPASKVGENSVITMTSLTGDRFDGYCSPFLGKSRAKTAVGRASLVNYNSLKSSPSPQIWFKDFDSVEQNGNRNYNRQRLTVFMETMKKIKLAKKNSRRNRFTTGRKPKNKNRAGKKPHY